MTNPEVFLPPFSSTTQRCSIVEPVAPPPARAHRQYEEHLGGLGEEREADESAYGR